MTEHRDQTSIEAPFGLYSLELAAERKHWYEFVRLVHSLTPPECSEPGYYRDPDWSVRDLVAHVGTWCAEAQVQFERIEAGTYEGHDIDIEALNAALLAGMADYPWSVVWVQAQAGRTRMVYEWHRLARPTDEAAWWMRKAASEHMAEHLDRLRDWVGELVRRRAADAL